MVSFFYFVPNTLYYKELIGDCRALSLVFMQQRTKGSIPTVFSPERPPSYFKYYILCSVNVLVTDHLSGEQFWSQPLSRSGFSALALLTSGAGKFFVVEAGLCADVQ